MNSRRKFIKNLTAVGATVPLVAKIEAKPKATPKAKRFVHYSIFAPKL